MSARRELTAITSNVDRHLCSWRKCAAGITDTQPGVGRGYGPVEWTCTIVDDGQRLRTVECTGVDEGHLMRRQAQGIRRQVIDSDVHSYLLIRHRCTDVIVGDGDRSIDGARAGVCHVRGHGDGRTLPWWQATAGWRSRSIGRSIRIFCEGPVERGIASVHDSEYLWRGIGACCRCEDQRVRLYADTGSWRRADR